MKATLKEIAELPELESVAFPYQIGCGLAGGDWKQYRAALEDFAERVKERNVKVGGLKRWSMLILGHQGQDMEKWSLLTLLHVFFRQTFRLFRVDFSAWPLGYLGSRDPRVRGWVMMGLQVKLYKMPEAAKACTDCKKSVGPDAGRAWKSWWYCTNCYNKYWDHKETTKQQQKSDSLAAVRCEAHIFGVVFPRVESFVTNLMQWLASYRQFHQSDLWLVPIRRHVQTTFRWFVNSMVPTDSPQLCPTAGAATGSRLSHEWYCRCLEPPCSTNFRWTNLALQKNMSNVVS